MLANDTISFIGAGAMAEALIRGLLAARAIPADHIIATGRRQERVDELHKQYGVRISLNNAEAAAAANIVVVAVKPQIMGKILNEIGDHIGGQSLVISVAAGIPISSIAQHLNSHPDVIRAMPNTPAIVGAGATAFAADEEVSAEHIAKARTIFDSVGISTHLDENLMDAVTGLSGSGPAYIFTIIEALSDAGVKVGLPRREAQRLAAQTVMGAAKLQIETGEHPGVLKDRVTSPGGTAIAGLHTLEEGGLRTTLINAVAAACARSRDLGKD